MLKRWNFLKTGFCEGINLLFRWFLDMNLMERSFDPTVFTKNRQRLLEHRIGQSLFDQVVVDADRHMLLSDRNRPPEHQISLRSHQYVATCLLDHLRPTSKTPSSAAC